MGQEHGVAFDDLRKSLCATDTRGAQRGCDGPPRRHGNKPGTGEQRHQLRHVIFVLRRDGEHAGSGRAARRPPTVRRGGQGQQTRRKGAEGSSRRREGSIADDVADDALALSGHQSERGLKGRRQRTQGCSATVDITCSRNAGSRYRAAAKAFSLPMPIDSNASIILCLQETGTRPALLNTASSSADAAASSPPTETDIADRPPLSADDERCSGVERAWAE
jgi:hypothetical protein